METILRYVIIAAVGALASILANQSIAVFNDGLRPVLPEYLEKRMDRKALAATSFAIGFGLVIGYGLPTSIAASIILIHCILLTTDIIGTWCPDTKKGIITAVVTLLVRQIVETYGKIALDAEHTISLNKDGMALLAGMIIMLVFAAMDKEGNDQNSNEMLTQIFADKVARIRKYMPVLALMGGLIAAGTSMSIMAGDPISLGLLAEGDRVNAGLTALARAIGFIPLVATTAITTGVYAPAGMTFVFVIGLLIPNPFIALIAGAACICVEILLLNVIAKGLDKFPGIKRCGDNIRTAMSYVIDIALLIGGILAAQAIMPTTGLFIIVAFWCINKCSKKPLVSMAVGPLGAILVGLIANVLFLLSLYTPAA